MEKLIGKTIKSIEEPDHIEVKGRDYCDSNFIITFTDGTMLKMASWDYEGYSSGIDNEIIYPEENTSLLGTSKMIIKKGKPTII